MARAFPVRRSDPLHRRGVRRLHGFANQFDLEAGFLDGLRRARKITGGPEARFSGFLWDARAQPDAVLPYVYASAAEEQGVVELIGWRAAGSM
jgi:hypothetical protein